MKRSETLAVELEQWPQVTVNVGRFDRATGLDADRAVDRIDVRQGDAIRFDYLQIARAAIRLECSGHRKDEDLDWTTDWGGSRVNSGNKNSKKVFFNFFRRARRMRSSAFCLLL